VGTILGTAERMGQRGFIPHLATETYTDIRWNGIQRCSERGSVAISDGNKQIQ